MPSVFHVNEFLVKQFFFRRTVWALEARISNCPRSLHFPVKQVKVTRLLCASVLCFFMCVS